MVRTGAFTHSTDIMAKSYYKGLVIAAGFHAATEGFMNVSMTTRDLLNEQYTVQPDQVFMEFIKHNDREKEQPPTLLLQDV